jgi:HPr kinase/phosphorylase
MPAFAQSVRTLSWRGNMLLSSSGCTAAENSALVTPRSCSATDQQVQGWAITAEPVFGTLYWSDVPVFQTGLVTMKFINLATIALDNLFAPRTQVHGCMVDIQGIGVIIQGESGIGKSEAVLGLLERGHSLVCDDIVQLTIQDGRELVGTGKAITRNLMEVRGIGIIDVAALFGIAAIRSEMRVDLVVTLKAWEKAGDIERLGIEQRQMDLLGIQVPHMDLPVRPGRDIARLIEVAALHTKLRLNGVNPAEDLQRRLMMQMNPRL